LSPRGGRHRQVLNEPQSYDEGREKIAADADDAWNDVELRPYFTSVHLTRVERGTARTTVDNRLTKVIATASTQTDADDTVFGITKATSSLILTAQVLRHASAKSLTFDVWGNCDDRQQSFIVIQHQQSCKCFGNH
jgi:hypothetical protein